jgi:hypothetical protein
MRPAVKLDQAAILAAIWLGPSACESPPAPVPASTDRGPDPWLELEPIGLEPARLLLTRAITDAIAPARVVRVPVIGGAMVIEGDGAGVHLLDQRYLHSADTACIEVAAWPALADGTDRSRGCVDEGRVGLSADLKVAGGVLAAGAGPGGIAAIGADGVLYRGGVDWEAGNPFDVMQLRAGQVLEGAADLEARGALAVGEDGTVFAAIGSEMLEWDAEGALRDRADLAAAATDLVLVAGEPWVLTAGGLVAPSATVAIDRPGPRLAAGEGGAWATRPGAGEIVFVGADGSRRALGGVSPTGPIAADAAAGKVYVAEVDGVAIVDAESGFVLGRIEDLQPTDLVADEQHELVVLQGNIVAVYADESAIPAAPPPLQAMVMAFFENPRRSDQESDCRGKTATVQGYVETALQNRLVLDDLPAPTALGITPEVARRVDDCDESTAFTGAWNAPRTEVGVLFHEAPECATLAACAEAMGDDLADFGTFGMEPAWTAGSAGWELDGADWVAATIESGAPAKLLVQGLNADDSVPFDDPRSKEPLAWRVDEDFAVFGADSGSDFGAGSGALAVYPGNPIAAFRHHACANLTVVECDYARLGADRFEEDDFRVLDLFLFRALAHRASTPSTWYFHLPAIELYDYTAECQVDARTWSGEDCQARMLQQWIFSVEQRYRVGGILEWRLPSEVGE